MLQVVEMGSDVLSENGRSDFTKVPAEVLVVVPVGDGETGGHANQQFVDVEPLGTKGDKLLRRQAAIVAELERFGHAGRDVLAPEHRCERQKLARQLRFQAGMPRPIASGGGSILIARGR